MVKEETRLPGTRLAPNDYKTEPPTYVLNPNGTVKETVVWPKKKKIKSDLKSTGYILNLWMHQGSIDITDTAMSKAISKENSRLESQSSICLAAKSRPSSGTARTDQICWSKIFQLMSQVLKKNATQLFRVAESLLTWLKLGLSHCGTRILRSLMTKLWHSMTCAWSPRLLVQPYLHRWWVEQGRPWILTTLHFTMSSTKAK